jgi:hypothetical protein
LASEVCKFSQIRQTRLDPNQLPELKISASITYAAGSPFGRISDSAVARTGLT